MSPPMSCAEASELTCPPPLAPTASADSGSGCRPGTSGCSLMSRAYPTHGAASRTGGHCPRRQQRKERSMTDLRLHKDVVYAFCADHLPQREEDELALQVARIYTCEPLLPNLTVSLLGKLTRHLGGGEQVLDWLSRHPGEPSLVAAVRRLSDLLAALSGQPAVIDAVGSIRSEHQRHP